MYKRVIRLEARREQNGTPFLTIEKLRITVSMDMNLAQALSQAHVTVYNLSRENQRQLTTGDHQPSTTPNADKARDPNKVYIRIYAGYEDEIDATGQYPLLIDGIVMNATSVRRRPESLTHLYLLPLSSSYLRQDFDEINAGINDGYTLRKLLRDMCVSAGYNDDGLEFRLPEEKLNQPWTGSIKSIGDQGLLGALNRLAKQYQFEYHHTAAGIGFYPRLNNTEAGISAFNVLQRDGTKFPIRVPLVRGTPIAGLASLEIPYTFDAKLYPGWVIDVGSIDGTRGDTSQPAQGIVEWSAVGSPLFYVDDVAEWATMQIYMVLRVVHKIDNYGMDWMTNIICTIPTAGDSGDGEIYG
ncbi:hypothetical protein [Vibrio phage vB_VpaM_VPs20]|uniref:Uncharacterized protein n=1 Tax=Vibrio phage vB_VpaM_VPs20 TaxID=2978980 RepID=A0A9X9JSJ3_9CAUD|nr:hypothetical protein QNH06_gp25 [Vibrio phage vB_VpaM_VPs20]UYD72125.1 hypothetical protein [Vibrio phage vB_VpaM_VPs20]